MFLTGWLSIRNRACLGLTGNPHTICSCTDKAIHTRRLTAVCKNAKKPGQLYEHFYSDYQVHKDIWEQRAREHSLLVHIWQASKGTYEYSLFTVSFFLFSINSQMANLQKLNASIICKKMNKIALQVQNKTDVLLFLVLFSYTVPVYAKCNLFQNHRICVSIIKCSSDNF